VFQVDIAHQPYIKEAYRKPSLSKEVINNKQQPHISDPPLISNDPMA
jgi:hypothetical protein